MLTAKDWVHFAGEKYVFKGSNFIFLRYIAVMHQMNQDMLFFCFFFLYEEKSLEL